MKARWSALTSGVRKHWTRPAPRRAAASLVALALPCVLLAQTGSSDPGAVMDRAVSDFFAGRITESVAGFDRLAALIPNEAPELWQRGIALYYAGRYRDCRAQFESHRTVNPDDVENAVWHFLCVARAESPASARAALLPVGPDAREPMREIYRMFQGSIAADSVSSPATSARGRVSTPPCMWGCITKRWVSRARSSTSRKPPQMSSPASAAT